MRWGVLSIKIECGATPGGRYIYMYMAVWLTRWDILGFAFTLDSRVLLINIVKDCPESICLPQKDLWSLITMEVTGYLLQIRKGTSSYIHVSVIAMYHTSSVPVNIPL